MIDREQRLLPGFTITEKEHREEEKNNYTLRTIIARQRTNHPKASK